MSATTNENLEVLGMVNTLVTLGTIDLWQQWKVGDWLRITEVAENEEFGSRRASDWMLMKHPFSQLYTDPHDTEWIREVIACRRGWYQLGDDNLGNRLTWVAVPRIVTRIAPVVLREEPVMNNHQPFAKIYAENAYIDW